MEVVYFELNNWFCGRDYPNAQPFKKWCGNDMNLYFNDENFVKENKLCVVATLVDMSCNWCITAPREWVEKNCPQLLTDDKYIMTRIITRNGVSMKEEEERSFKDFLREPDEDGDVYGRFGTHFKEYSEENIGITWEDDDEDDDYEEDED